MAQATVGAWKSADGTPTRLLLVRHGEVHDSARGTLYGQRDVPLSDRGRAQSQLTGLALRRYRIHAVYSSDLIRASFVAGEIARHHGLKPILSPLLRERHFGDWQGIGWDDLERQKPEEVARYNADRFHMRVPGESENFQDVQRRVLSFQRELLARHPGQAIAVCAHSGPIRLLLAEALQMPLQALFTFDQDYCCLNAIDFFPSGRVRVALLNSVEHLLELAVTGV